ncbi:hypothetical protein NDU88_008277, partial [Pleurodeles waltl]
HKQRVSASSPLCPACCGGGRTPCLSVQLSSPPDPHKLQICTCPPPPSPRRRREPGNVCTGFC